MKNFKRLTAALSAVTLAATMSISAFAAETTPSISDDKATLNIGTGITTVNGAQTTMMAYVVPGIIGADDTVPAFDATSHTIVALDQVDGTTGIASVPVDANKLADGNSIVVKISGTTGELATYVITMEAQATTYSVTYELDGGSVTGNNPATFTAEDTIAGIIGSLTAPEKDDYKFKGWATSATGTVIDTASTDKMTTLLSGNSTTLTLYAIYEKNVIVVYGDVNNDGVIDTADAAWVLSKYANSAIIFPCGTDTAGDVNNDGVIDTADAAWILSKYANSSTVFPAEAK